MARSAKPRIRGFKSRPRLSTIKHNWFFTESYMQALRQLLLKIQMFLAPRRVRITQLFFIVEILLGIVGFAVSFQAAKVYDSYFLEMYELGTKLGIAALLLYILTVLPGMFSRLQVMTQLTQPLTAIILPFRKHLGILMFITAWLHLNFTTTLPQLVANGGDASKIQLLLFQWMGEIAWWLLFPLWLTSNDSSVKYLGKWWKRVHRLTYIALFFIFLHVAMQRASWMYLIGTIAILQVVSWILAWRRSRNVQPAISTPRVPSAT